jgi:hypothetical protein
MSNPVQSVASPVVSHASMYPPPRPMRAHVPVQPALVATSELDEATNGWAVLGSKEAMVRGAGADAGVGKEKLAAAQRRQTCGEKIVKK